MIREAVILAGGFGTRLRPVVSDRPKSLALVNGKPFLHYVLMHLQRHGIEKIILSVGYMSQQLEDHFRNEYLGMEIEYAREESPMGTGGGIRLGIEKCKGAHVLALNGDTLFEVPLTDMFDSHLGGSADATLALRKVDDGSRYGTIQLDSKRIVAFREKSPEVTGEQWINGGVYVLRRKTYLGITAPHIPFSIEYDFFGKYADKLWLQGYCCENYFIDIGIPEDYARAQEEFSMKF